MGWKRSALAAVRRFGGLRLVEAFYGRSRLTVLGYHRVIDPDDPGFVGFRGNVSATPSEFAEQIAWIVERMVPVSIDQLVASLDGDELPDRAVLVTFDDGYRDNLTTAAPILARHGVPATIFLATDHIGTITPFWWDRVASLFEHSPQREADVPILGRIAWDDAHTVASSWIAAAKLLADPDKRAAVASLADLLGDGVDRFSGTLLTWDDARTLRDSGWAIGAHTCTHPILTRVDHARMGSEVKASVERVREKMATAVLGFAYPNGQPGDFDDETKKAVADAGVPLAFTLEPGPARPSEVRNDPHAIRRVYVHHGDDATRFAAKVAGVPRLMGRG